MMWSVTFWRSLVLPLLSLLASGVIVTAAIRRLPFSDPPPALLPGLIATALLTGVLLIVLPGLVQAMQACDPSLRQLIIGLMVGGAVIAFFSVPMPRPLAWQWGAGPQTGAPAPVSSAASWDGVNRSVVELHATNDPGATLYGVWRAVASLNEVAGVQPAQVDLWLTQPSWAVIDATTGRPPPTADGVDVVIGVQRGQDLLLERRVALDPPATPEQGRWHHVALSLPQGAERLAVEVQMRSTLAYDRVWMTEAVVRPTWSAVIDRAAFVLMVALGVSTLAFAGRMLPVISVSRRVVAFLSSYGYLLIGAACLCLGYLLVWQRGLYWDDWYVGTFVRDLRTLEWQPVMIPFERGSRWITWTVYPYLAALLWTHEFPVRLLMTICAGLNGLLLGWLVYRMLRATLPAVVAGWLFLMSNYAPLLTVTSAYVFMTGFVLLMLHAIWSALVVDRFQYVWLSGGILALLIALMWVEAPVGIVSVVPIMGVLGYVQQPEARRRTIVYRTALYTLMLTMAVVLYALWVTTTAIAQQRGGVTTDISMIIQRAYNWLSAFYYATLEPPNRYYLMYSYIVGVNYCISSVFGTVLLSVISVFWALTVATWKSEQSQYSNITQISVMLVFGIVWSLVTFFIPFVFVLGQGFEQYLAYIPLAGGGVLIGSLIGLITSVIRRHDIQRVLVGVFGVLLMILSLCMVGSARLYQVRYETDREVFTTLARLVLPEAISERVQFIPVHLEYSLPGKENMLSPFLDSALEEFWAAEGALTMAYSGKVPERHIQYIAAPRWHPATFSERVSDEPANPPCSRFARNSDTTAKGSPTLFVQGCPVDPERAIVFTHHNGELALVRTLTLQRSDGTTRIIELPVVSRLAARGSTVIETLVIPVKD